MHTSEEEHHPNSIQSSVNYDKARQERDGKPKKKKNRNNELHMQTSLILNLCRCSNSDQKRKRQKEHENETKHEYLGMRWTILKKGLFWLYCKIYYYLFFWTKRDTFCNTRDSYWLFFFSLCVCMCVCVCGLEIDIYMMMGSFGLVEQKGLREKKKKKRRGWWFHDQIMKSWKEKK